MEKIKQGYYYLFYKLYKSIEYTSEELGGKFMIAFKASIAMIVLEIWFSVTLLIYYNIFINPGADIIGTEIQWILMVLLLVLIDYILLHSKNQWKDIVFEFDKMPNKKNKMGSWIVFGVILLVTINFIFSFYLYYQS